MDARPGGFLADEQLRHDSQAFQYIVELHGYLWRIAVLVTPGASGILNNLYPMTIERLATLLREKEEAEGQIKQLADFIVAEVPGEPSQSQGAVETAVRVMRPPAATLAPLRSSKRHERQLHAAP